MPSSKAYRVPVWVPLAAMAVAIVVLICCGAHLRKRMKARWPW